MVNWSDSVSRTALRKSTEKGYWSDVFTHRPDVMYAMLGDLYQRGARKRHARRARH